MSGGRSPMGGRRWSLSPFAPNLWSFPMIRPARIASSLALFFAASFAVACSSPSSTASDSADIVDAKPACLFGETFAEVFESEDFEIGQEEEWSSGRGFSPLEEEQILIALHQSSHDDVETVEQAFEAVDGEVMNYLELTHKPSGQKYVAIEYGAGDNGFGAIFAAGSATMAASINDGDIMDCKAPPAARPRR